MFNHEALASGHSVYALDLPGHGSSSKQVGDGTLEGFAKVVEGFPEYPRSDESSFGWPFNGDVVESTCAQKHPERY